MDPIIAIINSDFEAAESIRGTLDSYQLKSVIEYFWDTQDWAQRDIAIHLLQDCEPTVIEQVMRDGLHSPTVESRAIAFCCLKNDFDAFPKFLRNGFVAPDLVDPAIQSEFGT